MILPSSDSYELQYQLARQDVVICVLVTSLLKESPTALCLDLRPVPQQGTHTWYYKPGQNHTARKSSNIISSNAPLTLRKRK